MSRLLHFDCFPITIKERPLLSSLGRNVRFCQEFLPDFHLPLSYLNHQLFSVADSPISTHSIDCVNSEFQRVQTADTPVLCLGTHIAFVPLDEIMPAEAIQAGCISQPLRQCVYTRK